MERYHGAIPWSDTMERYHGAIPWSDTIELYHGAIPWSHTMERYHGAPAAKWATLSRFYTIAIFCMISLFRATGVSV